MYASYWLRLMTEVVVVGQPHWARQVAETLSDPASDLVGEFIGERRYAGLLGRRKAPDVILRVGFRVGGTPLRARAFDAYWDVLRRRFPPAARAHYWIGTDVLNTLEEARAGTLRWSDVGAAQGDLHLVNGPWLADELRCVGLRAVAAYIPRSFHAPTVLPPLPAVFRVLSYVPGRRFSFYGGDAIIEAAARLPEVTFQIVGQGSAGVAGAPANVKFLGWMADMSQAYRDSTVVVRVPRHDGIGGTVIEGLLFGRHVVYTYPLPTCRQVTPDSPTAIVDAISELRDMQSAGTLAPNVEGRTYALEEFDEVRIAERLQSLLKELR